MYVFFYRILCLCMHGSLLYCVCVALNNEDVLRGAHEHVCVSPVCEMIWSSLNGYVHYRAMTRETLVAD